MRGEWGWLDKSELESGELESGARPESTSMCAWWAEGFLNMPMAPVRRYCLLQSEHQAVKEGLREPFSSAETLFSMSGPTKTLA